MKSCYSSKALWILKFFLSNFLKQNILILPRTNQRENILILPNTPYNSLKNPLEFLDLSLYPWKFQGKQAVAPRNSAKLCDTPWKFQGQKPRPMEIPQYFFLITPGISTSFLIDPWNLRMLFLQYPWNPMSLPLPPCLNFFWNNPMGVTSCNFCYSADTDRKLSLVG